jgi:hypothetical protein
MATQLFSLSFVLVCPLLIWLLERYKILLKI